MKRVLRTFAPLYPPLAVLALHAIALRLLYSADILADLLGSTSPSIPAAILLALFYVVRFAAFFICPGWLLVAGVRVTRALLAASAGRRASAV